MAGGTKFPSISAINGWAGSSKNSPSFRSYTLADLIFAPRSRGSERLVPTGRMRALTPIDLSAATS